MGRCSHCDSPDHNKRTCEKYTARLAAMAAGWDPDGLWSRAYAARIKPQKRPRAATLCGYCRASGHTRRTCPSLVEDRKWYTQVHNESVDILHSYLQRSHIGLGSLFKVRLSEWEGSNIRYVDRLYLLISLEMPNNLLTTGLQPHMVLREISSKGHHIRKPLRLAQAAKICRTIGLAQGRSLLKTQKLIVFSNAPVTSKTTSVTMYLSKCPNIDGRFSEAQRRGWVLCRRRDLAMSGQYHPGYLR